MRDEGFEGLADGVLLVTLLLIASVALVVGTRDPGGIRDDGIRDAEETRLALFRTTLDDLSYESEGETVRIPNGTTVEWFLRLQVHLLDSDPAGHDFSAANVRVLDLATRLVRPGYQIGVFGGVVGEPGTVRLPAEGLASSERFESAWTYPALDGGPGHIRLGVSLWFSPPR